MNNYIKADLFRYEGRTGLKGFIQAFFIPGFRYTFLLRKTANARKYSLSHIIYWLLLRRYSFKYGFQITSNTLIGSGLYIGHFGTIIINSNAIIGNNCNITAGVTIGQTNRGIKRGAPVIGNKVWIGVNASIVGGITIGDNVLIAPNAYVNFDIPPHSLVIGNPAKITPLANPTDKYIEFILKESIINKTNDKNQ